MTLVAIPPTPLWDTVPRASGYASLLLDASGEKAAYIFQAPKTGTIDRPSFRTGPVTTATDTDVRLETVGTDGAPSGTLAGTNTNVTVGSGSITANTWIEATLTAGYAATKGEWLAVVIAPTGTPNYNISRLNPNNSQPVTPYTVHYTGSWAKSGSPVGAIRYSDGSYGQIPGLMPSDTVTGTNYTTATNPDERGNKITVPFPCKVWGLWLPGTNQSGDFTLKLYDANAGSPSLLASLAVDGDYQAGLANNMQWFEFSSEITLAKDDVVRATRLCTAGTTNMIDFTCPSGLSAALPGGGQMVYTTRNDSTGGLTDTSNKIAAIGLILSALSDGTGGGGARAYSY